MSTLTAAAWVAAFLLILAGTGKVVRPEAADTAVRTARLPSHVQLIRLLGAGEVAVGLTVVIVGGAVPTAVLAIAYGAFAAFAQRQRGTGADCGCFGTTAAPVTRIHVWTNVLLAFVAAGAALRPASTLPAMAADEPVLFAVAAVLVVVAANLLRLLLTVAAELTAAIGLVAPKGAT